MACLLVPRSVRSFSIDNLVCQPFFHIEVEMEEEDNDMPQGRPDAAPTGPPMVKLHRTFSITFHEDSYLFPFTFHTPYPSSSSIVGTNLCNVGECFRKIENIEL